jgi:hypothetical protein
MPRGLMGANHIDDIASDFISFSDLNVCGDDEESWKMSVFS